MYVSIHSITTGSHRVCVCLCVRVRVELYGELYMHIYVYVYILRDRERECTKRERNRGWHGVISLSLQLIGLHRSSYSPIDLGARCTTELWSGQRWIAQRSSCPSHSSDRESL